MDRRDILMPVILSELPALPLYLSSVSAGFPSPAEDYVERTLNLHEYAVKHPASTFLLRVSGDSMAPGIMSGDILVVDRSLSPADYQVVVAVVAGEMVCKRLRFQQGHWRLVPDNPAYPDYQLNGITEDAIWGVVRWVLHNPNTQQ